MARARLLGHVNLALAQALDEIVGRQVHQLDFARQLQHLVGQRLAHLNAGDARHHVVQALDVLNVERGVNVDAGGQQVFNVLIALFVAAAGDVGVRQFVDQHDLRLALQKARRCPSRRNSGPRYYTCWRGTISRPRNSASVSARPCVSTTPTTTSMPSRTCACAASSME